MSADGRGRKRRRRGGGGGRKARVRQRHPAAFQRRESHGVDPVGTQHVVIQPQSFLLNRDHFLFQRGGPCHSDGLSAARNQLGHLQTCFCPAWKQDCQTGEGEGLLSRPQLFIKAALVPTGELSLPRPDEAFPLRLPKLQFRQLRQQLLPI